MKFIIVYRNLRVVNTRTRASSKTILFYFRETSFRSTSILSEIKKTPLPLSEIPKFAWVREVGSSGSVC